MSSNPTPSSSTSSVSIGCTGTDQSQSQQPCSQQRHPYWNIPLLFEINAERVQTDYFDLDSIISESTNIGCTFDHNTPPELFSLLGQKTPENISVEGKGHRTNAPAWMLPVIYSFCTFSIPAVYNAVNREVIHAGAYSANLESLQRHYYTLGVYICQCLREISTSQAREIAQTLISAFIQRIGWILRDATNTLAKPRALDQTEKHIFWAMQKAERRKEEWNCWVTATKRRSRKRKQLTGGIGNL